MAMSFLYAVVLGACFASSGILPMFLGAVAGFLLGSMMES